MNIVIYAIGSYVLTAIIAFLMIGLVVILNNVMNKKPNKEGTGK